jgi:YggT family protein|tara:strand:+ start:977 stop:1225 length:249 start_codon:yes stop_codon:yes gene_type:complete
MLSINGIIWISIEFIYWLIIARVFLSWIPVNISYTIKRLIYNLTDPLLDLFRKIIPPFKSGIDLSPMLVLIALKILQSILIS